MSAAMSALPWARRAWRVLPRPLRIPVLIVIAGVAVWYLLSGREQLRQASQAEGTHAEESAR